MGIEREIKLSAWAGFALPDLTGAVDGLSETAMAPVQLTATYYDTPDLRLTRSGLSLRHRFGGGESGWTVKLPEGSDGPALVRRELNFEGAASVIPDGARSLVRVHVRNAELVPVAKLVTKRQRVDLRDGEQRPLAEIDDDEVSVLEGRRVAARFREIEVELAAGADAALMGAVVEQLRFAGAGSVDPVPKIVRALGTRATAPPDLAAFTKLDRDATVADLVRATIANGVTRLIRHDPGVRLGDDPEDVHQARVATRRLRSDLRTYRRLLDVEWTSALRDELRWIAGELGKVRDADVLTERLREQAAELPPVDAAGAAALLRRLAAERAAARDEMAVALDSARYIDLVDDLVRAAHEPRMVEEAVDLPAGAAAGELVQRPWKHLVASVDALGKDPEDELLHEVRKRAKQCRYAAEAVVPVVGKPASRLASAVAGVQEVLGGLQDAVVAEDWLRHAAASGGTGAGPRALAAGQLVARQRAEMEVARLGVEERVEEGVGQETPRLDVIRAAGGVIPRKRDDGELEVLLVHRPKYDDWSLPKGKAEPGESDEETAIREVEEETGLRCRLGRELPTVEYHDRFDRPKRVRYWVMEPEADSGEARADHEIDVVRWLPLAEAAATLSYQHDRDLLLHAFAAR